MSVQPSGRITNVGLHPSLLVQACTTCGLLVADGYAERHAERHIAIGDEFRLPSVEAAERAGNVAAAREASERAARRALEERQATLRQERAARLGITLEQLAEIEAAEAAQAARDREHFVSIPLLRSALPWHHVSRHCSE